ARLWARDRRVGAADARGQPRGRGGRGHARATRLQGAAAPLTATMRLAWVLIATVALGAARAPAAPDPVTSTMKVAGGKAVVQMTIASGWHVQSHDPSDKFLIPTTLDVTPPAGQRAGPVEYPTAVEKALEFAEGKKLRLYEGRVTLAAPLEG